MGIVTGPVRRGDGVTPAVALVEPKFPHNAGAAVRAASCYGVRQVWFSGDPRVPVHCSPGRLTGTSAGSAVTATM